MDMRSEEERLIKMFIQNEELLLNNDGGNDTKKISDIIDANCIEFSESGKINSYYPGKILDDVDGVLYIDDASAKLINLSEDCKLLLYVATKVKKNARMKENCSSTWKKTNGKWKIIFHQRTNCSG